MRWEQERPKHPKPGKCENIPGDGRLVMLRGQTYRVRSFETYIRKLDEYRRGTTKHDEIDFDAMAEGMKAW